MKHKHVNHMRFHVGVQVGGNVLTSMDKKKHDAEMELAPMGVHAKVSGKQIIVPYTNIHFIELCADEARGD